MPSAPSRSLLALSASAASAVSVLGAAPARAEPPTCDVRWARADQIAAATARAHGPRLVYLNRCAGGCAVSPGVEDSRENTSIVPDAHSTLPPYPYGDQAWDELVACVRDLFAPFDVVFTENDPSPAVHAEAIVAGSPTDVGQPFNVGGVAPFNCGVIDNPIAFSFAELYQDVPRALCETVAHELGHTFGLDHEFWCEDPMTYESGCGEKSFQDVDAECGEDEARECMCGRASQNSYAHLDEVLNSEPFSPPSLAIVQPQNGQAVEPGFTIEVAAADDVSLASVEAFLDGVMIGQSAPGVADPGPTVFTAPDQLPIGSIELRVVATDDRGDQTDGIIVLFTAECTAADPCGEGQACDAGICVDRDDPDDSGGGCGAASGRGGTLTGLLILVAMLVTRRRRRR